MTTFPPSPKLSGEPSRPGTSQAGYHVPAATLRGYRYRPVICTHHAGGRPGSVGTAPRQPTDPVPRRKQLPAPELRIFSTWCARSRARRRNPAAGATASLGPRLCGQYIHTHFNTHTSTRVASMADGSIRYAGTGRASNSSMDARRRKRLSSTEMHAATLTRLSETGYLASNSNKIWSARLGIWHNKSSQKGP